jgi:chromosome segregation ATPase
MPSPAERLRCALVTLTQDKLDDDRIPTVTELCRLASVSRNSLYRYHPETLKALHEFRRERRMPRSPEARTEDRFLRDELRSVREQIPNLVALVDQYYAAYHETRTLLERRERELAELRRRLDTKPSRIDC